VTLRERYERYVSSYRTYARMRGFTSEVNDWPYVRRSFLECWAEPGFHRFWQVWNPGISYFVYRLFLRLGGRRRWVVPTLLSFVLCGVIHTVIVAPFLRQERWPALVNVLLNAFLVLGSFDIGFRVDRFLRF
jgi:hypothetical protein